MSYEYLGGFLENRETSAVGRIYVAGPMRGFAAYNFPAFDQARDYLIRMHWTVLNPADIDREFGLSETCRPDEVPPLATLLRRDFAVLCTADAVAFLPGWKWSTGANAELDIARHLGLDLYRVDPNKPMFAQTDFFLDQPHDTWSPFPR